MAIIRFWCMNVLYFRALLWYFVENAIDSLFIILIWFSYSKLIREPLLYFFFFDKKSLLSLCYLSYSSAMNHSLDSVLDSLLFDINRTESFSGDDISSLLSVLRDEVAGGKELSSKPLLGAEVTQPYKYIGTIPYHI